MSTHFHWCSLTLKTKKIWLNTKNEIEPQHLWPFHLADMFMRSWVKAFTWYFHPPPPPTPTPRLKILCCFMFLCTCAKKNPNYVEGVGSCWINLSVVQSLKWSNLFMTLIKRVFSQLMLIIVSCCVSCQILSWKSCWVIFFICKRQMQSNADKGLFILYIIAFKECSNHAQIRHA